MQSLFPTNNNNTRNQATPPLVEFKAGRCNLAPQSNGKFLVTPDKTSGQITLSYDQSGRTFNFNWSSRTDGNKDSRVLVQSQANLKKINTGTATDRVYTLKFSNNGPAQPLVFWLQDKDSSKDEESIKKVNDYINDPSTIPVPAAAQPDLMSLMMGGGPGMLGHRHLAPSTAPPQGAFGGLDLSSLLGGGLSTSTTVNPSPSAIATPSAQRDGGGGGGVLTGEDLRRAMEAAGVGGTTSTSTSSSTSNNNSNNTTTSITTPASPSPSLLPLNLDFSQLGVGTPIPAPAPAPSPSNNSHLDPRSHRPIPLQELLTPEAILSSGVLNDPAVRQQLLETLPPSQRNANDLEETIRSAQFRQALQSLSQALVEPHPPSYASVLSNLGLDPSVAMPRYLHGDAIGGFLSAVQSQALREMEATTSISPPTATSSSTPDSIDGVDPNSKMEEEDK